jgi:type IV pilus assembly protein PilB
MVDMGLDPFLVSCSVLLVAAQRLCRTLCANCKKPVDVPKDRLLNLGFLPQDFEQEFTLYQTVGCAHCNQGYRGRFAVVETLVISEAIKRMIVEGKAVLDIKARGIEEGMQTLRRTAILNAIRGKTSLEEVLRVTLAD